MKLSKVCAALLSCAVIGWSAIGDSQKGAPTTRPGRAPKKPAQKAPKKATIPKPAAPKAATPKKAATPRPAASKKAPKKKDFLDEYISTYGFRLGLPRRVTVAPGGDVILFLRSRHGRSLKQNFYLYDVKSQKQRLVLDLKTLAKWGGKDRLSAQEKALRERQRRVARGISLYRLSRDGKLLLIGLGGRLFVGRRWKQQAGATWQVLKGVRGAFDPRFSPDGTKIAYIRKGDLYVYDLATRRSKALTKRASKHVRWGLAEFVAQEEMGRYRGYWWSPDGRRILCQETDTKGVEQMYISDPAAPTRKPRGFPYPRPGKKNAKVRLWMLHLDGKKAQSVAWDHSRYPYLVTVRWPDKGPLTVVVQDRRQTACAVLAWTPATRRFRTLHTETDGAWLNIDQRVPWWLSGGKGFLWTTERRGRWQLESYDALGRLRHVLTPKSLGFRRLLGVHEAAGVAYVTAGLEPTEQHLYRISLDPTKGKPHRLSRASGWHRATFARGPKADIFVHWSALRKGGWGIVVRDGKGSLKARLPSVAVEPPWTPRLRWWTVGARKWRAVSILPQGFRKDRRYPVLLHIYGGPHGQMVRAAAWRYLRDQWMANAGAIVVCIDGRGTPHRGRAWERAIQGKFVALPLQDQIAALKALAQKLPQMDLSRVGIYGWSFGGTMAAMATIRRPELFKVGVAGAPVTDWRYYDTHYTERYLGLPHEAPMAYLRSAPLTYAGQLSRPLLLIHGTADDNVYFAHSLKLAGAFFLAGLRFSFAPLVGATHMVRKPAQRKQLMLQTRKFLLKHLKAPR